jgi:quercetin 2,3-dioxygenase
VSLTWEYSAPHTVITRRTAEERHSDPRREEEVWLAYSLAPGKALPRHVHHDGEVITYVREGALAYQDSSGRSCIIETGQFQRMSTRRGMRHEGMNISRTDRAEVVQLWLRATDAPLPPGQELQRFSAAQRRGILCPVASPDARGGSLQLHQDCVVYSALLVPGQQLAHELASGRTAWLHVAAGEVALRGITLRAGDGACITGEHAVSITSLAESEILLLDMSEPRDELEAR